MMIPGFVKIIVIEVSYVLQKKNSFGPKCHGCVFFLVIHSLLPMSAFSPYVSLDLGTLFGP